MPTEVELTAMAASASIWVDQAAAARQRVTDTATTSAGAAWAAFGGWYAAGQVTGQATQVASLSGAAQGSVASALAEYIAQVTALLTGRRRVSTPPPSVPRVRNGADPIRVHTRPARVYRETFALTADPDLATQRAIDRAIQLIETDVMLAALNAELEAMVKLEISQYRRVLRPELSDSGPCGLCVVAADQIYSIEDLMPLHDRCKCGVIPIASEADIGARLNRDDLNRIYAAAGSSKAADLKRTRVEVNEHGELGPVLTLRGQKFTGPAELGRPPEGARLQQQRLDKLQGVLGLLEQRSDAGQDLGGALAYQRAAIDRSRRILAA